MRNNPQLSVYAQVARDIAMKIATGDIAEHTKFSGRSLMSSQYGVSQETIRRALHLLDEYGVVEIHRNTGAEVLSRKRAADYLSELDSVEDLRALRHELHTLVEQRKKLDERITQVVYQIADLNERFRDSDPLRNYEFTLSPDTRLVGKSLRESRFWQNTGTTLVAIIRKGEIHLSPGPDAVFEPDDVIIVAGAPGNVERVRRFIQESGG